jgi:hypothetical protein
VKPKVIEIETVVLLGAGHEVVEVVEGSARDHFDRFVQIFLVVLPVSQNALKSAKIYKFFILFKK